MKPSSQLEPCLGFCEESVWELPGPRRYLEESCRHLNDGECVVLLVPPSMPGGLAAAFQRHGRALLPHHRWHKVDLTDADRPVRSIDDVVQQLSSFGSRGAATVEDLTADPDDRIYLLEGLQADNHATIRRFVDKFRDANHRRAECDRDLLVVVWPADVSRVIVDVGIRCQAWKRVISPRDSQLFLDQLDPIRESTKASYLRAVRHSMIGSLAGPDLSLAAFLVACDLPSLIEPEAALKAYRNQCSWSQTLVSGEELKSPIDRWSYGWTDEYEGSEYRHAVGLLGAQGRRELIRRVWRGQLRVIFPLLEEARVNLIPSLRPLLRGRILVDNNGQPTSVEDLELGELVHHLRGQHIPPEQWRRLKTLRDARHDLAHLRPLDANLLQRVLGGDIF